MRLGGFILFVLFVIPTVIGYFCMAISIFFVDPKRLKEAMRSIDEFNNAFWLNGYGRESVSSHAWRDKDKPWAKFVIWLTDKLQKGHCEEANKHEQPIVNFINGERDA